MIVLCNKVYEVKLSACKKPPTLTNDKILNAYKSQMLTLWFCFATIFLVYHCIKNIKKYLH